MSESGLSILACCGLSRVKRRLGHASLHAAGGQSVRHLELAIRGNGSTQWSETAAVPQIVFWAYTVYDSGRKNTLFWKTAGWKNFFAHHFQLLWVFWCVNFRLLSWFIDSSLTGSPFQRSIYSISACWPPTWPSCRVAVRVICSGWFVAHLIRQWQRAILEWQNLHFY